VSCYYVRASWGTLQVVAQASNLAVHLGTVFVQHGCHNSIEAMSPAWSQRDRY
jgi:3-deoxy-D-manno-octulosonic-acid transferase